MSYGKRVWQARPDAARYSDSRGPNGPGGQSRAGVSGEPGNLDAFMEAFDRTDEDKRAIALYQMDTTARMAQEVLGAAPEERPRIYDAALRRARSMGMPVGNLPPDYDRSVDPMLEQQIGAARAFLDRAGGARKQE